MTQRVATRELERQLRKEPENLALRLRLAASYREAGRNGEAVQLYRSVAVAYHAQRRLAQAIAVCRSVLEIEPGQPETLALLAELEAMGPNVGALTGEYALVPEPPAPPGEARPVTGQVAAAPRPTTHTTGTMAALPRPPGHQTGTTPQVPKPTTGPLAQADASSPGMPAVRMLDQDISVRELTPVRTLQRTTPPPSLRQRPSTGPRRIAQVVTPPPTTPAPTTGTDRSSSPEDTPLPRPVPFHDVGEDSVVHMIPGAPVPRDARVPPPVSPPPRSPRLRDLPDTSPQPTAPPPGAAQRSDARSRAVAPTMPAPVSREPTGETRLPLAADAPVPTPIAPGKEGSTRHQVAAPRLPAKPPRRMPTPIPDDEDAVTHVSGDWPIAVPSAPLGAPPATARPPLPGTGPIGEPRRPDLHRAQTRPAVALPLSPNGPPTGGMDLASDLETRRLPRLTARDLELLAGASRGTDPGRPPDLDDEPTHPPANPAAPAPLPAELATFARGGRLLDVDPPWGEGEEITDARSPDLPPGEHVEAVHPSPVFDRPFAETLQGLGPDGSAIEAPTTGLLGIFSTLPHDVVVELERQMIVRHVRAGEMILREGDRGDSCFVIGAGEVRVLKSDPLDPHRPDERSPDAIEVARLGEGALFGEFALLADRRRHASVQAVTAGELYEIPRRLLRELAAGHPEVGPALERFYRERLLSTLLTTAPFFKPLPEDRRADLLARFTPVHADAGHSIVREGEQAGGFYLIVLGAVDIVRNQAERRPILLATLREGAYFGEMSLMSGHEASASVIAAGPVELAFLPPKAFYDVVSAHPKLWAAMRAEVRHRELENARIVAGDSTAV